MKKCIQKKLNFSCEAEINNAIKLSIFTSFEVFSILWKICDLNDAAMQCGKTLHKKLNILKIQPI